jgi:hypothetical protein
MYTKMSSSSDNIKSEFQIENGENASPYPAKLGKMRCYWYNKTTGQPRIVIGSNLMFLGSVPLMLMGFFTVQLQIYGLLNL